MGVNSSSATSDTIVETQEFWRHSPNSNWHRANCKDYSRRDMFHAPGYRADVEDPIHDFPVFGFIQSCCATEQETDWRYAHSGY